MNTELQSAHRMMVDTLNGMMQIANGLKASESRRVIAKGYDIQANAQALANVYASTLAVLGATPDEHKKIRAEFEKITKSVL